MFTDHPHNYNDVPMSSAAAAEANAIYQSLRYITNVGNYKILDLNHSTLTMLMSSITRQDTDLILLQTCVNAMIGHCETVYESFLHLQDEFTVAATDTEGIQHIEKLIDQLMSYVESYHTSMVDAFHEFMHFKVPSLPLILIHYL